MNESQGGAMEYLWGFEHDIFINLGMVDNEPPREGEKGWVSINFIILGKSL